MNDCCGFMSLKDRMKVALFLLLLHSVSSSHSFFFLLLFILMAKD